jgi:two-component system chemotaxis response regulator CheY
MWEWHMAKTVLVVDDSASFRTVVSLTLKQQGYGVVEAADGMEAAELVGQHGYKLIVCDLNMPKLDGFGLTRRIRASVLNRTTPVLMLTTESQTSKKKEGREAGVTAWLPKPFQPSRLVMAVNTLCPA